MTISSTSAYTPTQGRYLAFIHFYTRVNGRPPAQSDMQRFFEVSPPTVHQMLLALEKKGLIERTPRTPRSLRVLISTDTLHALL